MQSKVSKIIISILYMALTINSNYSQSIRDKIAKVDSLIVNSCDTEKPGVVALISQNGVPIYKKAIGISNIEKNKYLTTQNSFAIGSLTKQFTAMAAMILVSKNLLKLSDSIDAFFDNAEKFRGIKIHNLLTHSSGIKDLFKIDKWRKDLNIDLSKQETLKLIAAEELEFNPGEQVRYTNSGYFILGLIIEYVSGKPLNIFLKENILEPLEMNNTSFIDDDNYPTAKGYEKIDDLISEPFKVDNSRFYAGGSMITTVDDLLKWDEALYTNKLINDKLLSEYFKPFVLNDGQQSVYASGWEVLDYQGIKLFGHGGGINGYVCQVYRIPEHHLYVAFLSNLLDRNRKISISALAQKTVSILLEGKRGEVKCIFLNEEELNQFSGEYLLPNNTIRQIEMDNAKLYYIISPGKRAELIPISDKIFRVGNATKIQFYFNDEAQVGGFELNSGRGKPINAKKIIN